LSRSNTSHGGHPEKGPVFYGWWILLLGALINGVGTGIIYHSMSVFFLPLKRDLGVSSTAISLLYGAARLEGGFEGPLVGYLIDRFGARKLILIGTTLTGLGLILLTTVESFFTFFLVYVFIVSLGSNAGLFHPISTLVNQWFIRHRGLGFSVITASGSVGGMIMAPLLSFIILNYGWRTGAAVAGFMILAVAIPAALPLKRSPEEMGLHPDGRAPSETRGKTSDPGGQIVVERSFSVRQAVRTLHFWLLMTCICLRLMVTVGLNTHFVPLLVWKGMSEATSAYLLGLFALLSVPLAIGLGWIGDRWNKARLSSICILPIILAMMGMIFFQGEAILYFFPVAFAFVMGTTPLNWALIGDYFGRGSYATLRGIMGVGYGTATFLSPIYAGWIFDLTESYNIVLLTFSIIMALAAFFFAVLSPPQSPPPQSPPAKKIPVV
jgi:MCP family monocarboxylic acid transporter-like MFS transporter 13